MTLLTPQPPATGLSLKANYSTAGSVSAVFSSGASVVVSLGLSSVLFSSASGAFSVFGPGREPNPGPPPRGPKPGPRPPGPNPGPRFPEPNPGPRLSEPKPGPRRPGPDLGASSRKDSLPLSFRSGTRSGSVPRRLSGTLLSGPKFRVLPRPYPLLRSKRDSGLRLIRPARLLSAPKPGRRPCLIESPPPRPNPRPAPERYP